jgi:hypothetical protein
VKGTGGGDLNVEEVQLPGLVQGLQPDAVLDIDGRLPEGEDHVRLAGRVELEMLRLPRLYHPVLGVLHHHKVLKGGQVHCICCVLLWLFIVDLSDELAFLNIAGDRS